MWLKPSFWKTKGQAESHNPNRRYWGRYCVRAPDGRHSGLSVQVAIIYSSVQKIVQRSHSRWTRSHQPSHSRHRQIEASHHCSIKMKPCGLHPGPPHGAGYFFPDCLVVTAWSASQSPIFPALFPPVSPSHWMLIAVWNLWLLWSDKAVDKRSQAG